MTTQPPNHRLATLRLFLNGLSLFHKRVDTAHPDLERYELDMLSVEHSNVYMYIDDEHGDKVWEWEADPAEKVILKIEKERTLSAGDQYSEGATPTNDEDIRWMPDFSDWHGRTVERRANSANHMPVRVGIRDAVFYTELKSDQRAIITDIISHTELKRALVGRILGADIVCTTGEAIVITAYDRNPITGQLQERARPPRHTIRFGQRQSMSIAYTDEVCEHGDPLGLLYDYFVDSKDGKQFTLEYEQILDPWKLNGLVADTRSPDRTVRYTTKELLEEIPREHRRFFNSGKEAERADYKVVQPILSDQYACQGYGGGGQPPLEFP